MSRILDEHGNGNVGTFLRGSTRFFVVLLVLLAGSTQFESCSTNRPPTHRNGVPIEEQK